MRVLTRRRHAQLGKHPSMGPGHRETLGGLYAGHRSWSRQLLFDNVAVLSESDARLCPMPSYSTWCRYMRDEGMERQPRQLGPQVVTYRTVCDRCVGPEITGFRLAMGSALGFLPSDEADDWLGDLGSLIRPRAPEIVEAILRQREISKPDVGIVTIISSEPIAGDVRR